MNRLDISFDVIMTQYYQCKLILFVVKLFTRTISGVNIQGKYYK